MFIVFGEKKCPLCGTGGEETEFEKLYSCPSCKIHFNDFGIASKNIFVEGRSENQ